MFRVLLWVSQFISAVGAINWGLVTFFNFNLVDKLAQIVRIQGINKVLYAVVTVAGIFALVSLFSA